MRKTGDHPFYWHTLKVAEMVVEKYTKTDVVIAQYCMIQLKILIVLWGFKGRENVKLLLEQILNKLSKLGDNEILFIKQMDRQQNLEIIEILKPRKQ